jgi:hypothetical protein
VAAAARARSEIAIGYRLAAREGRDAEIVVNPTRADQVRLGVDDRVVVIGPPE